MNKEHFDDEWDAEFDDSDSPTCDYCGAVLKKSYETEEFWGSKCYRTEWVCPNCG